MGERDVNRSDDASQGQPESKVDCTLVNALLTGHSRSSLPTVCIPLGISEHL